MMRIRTRMEGADRAEGYDMEMATVAVGIPVISRRT